MKKRLIALAVSLVLVLAAVPAFAGSLVLNNALVEMQQHNDPATQAPTATPTVKPTAKPTAVPTEEPQVSADLLTTPYGERVFDKANLFSQQEEAEINERIAQFQRDHGMDFAVVTYNGPMRLSSAQDEADVFYEDGCLAGVLGNVEPAGNDEDSGMLLYINLYEGEYHVSTTGRMIDYITDSRGSSLNSELGSGLRSGRQTGDYASCVLRLLDSTSRYVRQGIPEGQYQYDVVTGQMLTPRHKALTSGEILVSGIIGLVVCLIFTGSVNSSYSLKHSTYSYAYRQNSKMSLSRSSDQYLRTSVSRTRRYTDSGRGSGGGFGGGGGSGVHVSSGGGSHGGFGGKF
ncbi:MAG: TPM domain-containing protein [Clostridia bacterium]|nr:TPM domain-containing protein [Clostridia bacterium]